MDNTPHPPDEADIAKNEALRAAVLAELDRLFPPKPPLPRFAFPLWLWVGLLSLGLLLGQSWITLPPAVHGWLSLKKGHHAQIQHNSKQAIHAYESGLHLAPQSRRLRLSLIPLLNHQPQQQGQLLKTTPVHPWHLTPALAQAVSQNRNTKLLQWAWPWNLAPLPTPEEILNKQEPPL